MSLTDQLRRMRDSLPSDASCVTLTRADLTALLADDGPEDLSRDLTVEGVAEQVGRAPSTVRGWLIAGQLQGYKLNGRDWRVTRRALQAFLTRQSEPEPEPLPQGRADISAWRRLRGHATRGEER
jgi:excisionase family DNA binding protein